MLTIPYDTAFRFRRNQDVKKIGLVGGTGYTGVELLRMLQDHPEVEILTLTSRSEAGKSVTSLYPWLTGYGAELVFAEPSSNALANCDLVFFATPNKIAMEEAIPLLERGIQVIDLAADFRFSDTDVWSATYGGRHAAPTWNARAVYGLPELYRDAIRGAQLVGNPGCYPTATTLPLAPLLKANMLSTDIIVDAKSGASGAGRSARVDLIVAEASDNFHAYGADGHRHGPEIAHQLSRWSGQPIEVTFVPHLLPMIRGIEVTIYASIKDGATIDDVRQALHEAYADEPLIDIVGEGIHPETRWVRGSNCCRIGVYQQHPGRLILSSVIDNLVKGAAGQAIQNMNLMLGLDEWMGIPMRPLAP